MTWLARIRRDNMGTQPPATRDYMVRSEVATLKFLETTSIPAPKVFDYVLEGAENPVGVGYMLIEKLPGYALDWPTASSQHRNKVVEQLTDVYLELQHYPFSRMGSLDTPGSRHVGPLIH